MSSWVKNHFLPLMDQNPKSILVIRHGQREEIKPGSFGNELGLTLEGRQASLALGNLLSKRHIGEVHTSPILRCVQTAEELLKGAGQRTDAMMSQVLGDPGPFIIDPVEAGPLFLRKSLQEIAQSLVNNKKPPGMCSLMEGGHLFLSYLSQVKEFPCFMISHDIIICLLCCFLFESTHVEKYMPDFLDGFGIIVHSDALSIHHPYQSRFLKFPCSL